MVGQNKTYLDNFTKYWYRQRVVDKIHELNLSCSDNQPLLPDIIKKGHIDLLKASIILFGSWQNALTEAGIFNNQKTFSKKNKSELWSEENILEQIKSLHNFKFELSAHFIKQIYPELYYIAIDKQMFGSWYEAVAEAGVAYKYLRALSNKFWTLDRIFKTIYDYENAYGNLQPEFIKALSPSLYMCTHRYFKTWSAAVKTSGLKLERNLIKTMLEPLRTFILLEYIKKIFDKLNIEYKIITEPIINKTPIINSSKLLELLDIVELPKYSLLTTEYEGGAYITTNYRSWGFIRDLESNDVNKKYGRLVYYYSVGEPRRWWNDYVKFINVTQFYPELAANGWDDVISALRKIARGGIPKEHQSFFEEYIKKIKKILKNNK